MKRLAAEELPDDRDIKFQCCRETRLSRACLGNSGYSRQVDRGEQVSGRIVSYGLPANLYLFSALNHHHYAWLVGDVARRGRSRSPMQRQAGNQGFLLLCRADQFGNSRCEFASEFRSPVSSRNRPKSRVPDHIRVWTADPRIAANWGHPAIAGTRFGRIRRSFGRIGIPLDTPFSLRWL